MKRYICIDDIGQDMEAMLKLLREHGYSVSESSGDQAYLTNPMFCSADSPGIRSVKEAATFGDAASGDAPRLEEPFQRVFRASPDATLVTRVDDGFVLDSNESFMELTGYGRDEMLGQNILNLVFFLNPEFWTQVFLRLEAEGEVQDLETRIWRKDGLVAFVLVSLRRVEINGIPCHVITLRDKVPSTSRGTMDLQWSVPDGGLESLLSEDVDVNRDDVGRLIDFQALQDLMNSFYKITRIGIGINDIKGNVQVATGWQDVCTRFFRIHPEALKNCLESDIYLSGKLGQGEALYKCKHGMWELATPLVIGGRHIANIFLGQFFFEDEVPDYDFFRKQAQAYGFDSEEFLAALDRVPRWSRELVQNVMEFYKKLAVMISQLSIGTIQISQALARQKSISEELRQANLVMENSPVVVFRWRAEEGWPVELVSSNVTRFGYAREELLSGSVPFSSLVHPDDLQRVVSEVGGYTAAGNDSFQQEYRIVTREGVVRWIDDRTVIERDAEGRVTHYQGIVMDITERRQVEERLLESEDRLRSVFRVAPIGIGVVRDRVLLEVNNHLCEMVGYTQEELVGESAYILYPDREEFERVGRDKYRQIGEKGTGSLETRWRRRDDAIIEILLASTPMDPSDLSKGVTFTALDITERKRAEEALRESEEKFRVLAETSPAGIILYQGERIIYANCATSRIFGYSVDELLEMVFWERVHEDFVETVRERGRARLGGEDVPNQYECKFVSKDGEAFWAIISVGCMEYKGKPAGIVTLIEISEMKRSEQRLQVSLAEKTIMLKEIHHRVKNNLQIISSLLELQSDSIPDEDSRRSFSESQNRIRSMALVHEKLYQTESFSSISFGDYIDNLTQYLFSTLAKDPDQILFTIDAGDFLLGIDEAIPCGLIVNELVSNCLKHAFPDGRGGEIAIRCRVEEDGWITLKVSDNGVGMSPGLDFSNTETLGLQLVTMLVKQLQGRITIDSEPGGTAVMLSFPGCPSA